MLAQAVACALDVDADSVVKEAVEQRGGDDGMAEEVTPFGEAAIWRQDHRAALVAGIDQLEEQITAAGHDWQVAYFVDDKQLRPAQEPQALAQAAFALGLSQRR